MAFARSPSLHDAAHEAAHVVQQRSGFRGVGQAGDRHERHADQVADAVARGDSAEALLDGYGGQSGDLGRRAPGVQRRGAQRAT